MYRVQRAPFLHIYLFSILILFCCWAQTEAQLLPGRINTFSFGSALDDSVKDIAICSSDQSILVTGYFTGTVDLDFTTGGNTKHFFFRTHDKLFY